MDECEINQAYLVHGLQAQSPNTASAAWQGVLNEALSSCPQIVPAINAAQAAATTNNGGGDTGGGSGGGSSGGGSGGGGSSSGGRGGARCRTADCGGTADDPNNPYFCGYPGATVPRTPATIGGCNWDMDAALRSNNLNTVKFKRVSLTDKICSSDTECPGQACGTAREVGIPNSLQIKAGRCGTHLGYWSASYLCSISLYTNPPGSLPCIGLQQLYKCDQGISSCYSPNPGSGCCGCVNWESKGITVGAAPYTMECQNSNPNWVSAVLPQIIWMKAMCPTVYTYPYDDKSSSFTCRNSPTNNMVNYDIIFCPSSKTTRADIPKPTVTGTEGYRIIAFHNYCNYDVWPALSGGSVSSDHCSLSDTSTCPTHSTCRNAAPGINYCYWDNPAPEGGSYYLAPGNSLEFHIPVTSNKIIWSGIMSGRLFCSDTAECAVANCGPFPAKSNGCSPARGFDQSATQAEFTMQNDMDYYDVETIDGVSLPIAVMPDHLP